MEINRPEVLAEVQAAFAAYERALTGNDVAALDALFWDSAHTVRYGIAENLHGSAEIAAFRAARPSAGLMRSLSRTVITTYGTDFATAATLFHRDSAPGRVGRQLQSWVRLGAGAGGDDGGWRVVAAHVSLIEVR